MGRSSAPKSPDPAKTAAAQTQVNIDTAIAQQRLGQISQTTPWGRLDFRQTGSQNYVNPHDGSVTKIPQFAMVQSLSPQAQRIHDARIKAKGALAGVAAARAARLGSLPALRDVPAHGPQLVDQIADAGAIRRSYGSNFAAQRNAVQDALLARLSPSLEEDRRALEVRLAGQGITAGSAAFDRQIDTHNRARNDARLAAILGAGTEQSRLVGMEADRARFANAAQAQKFAQNAARAGFTNAARQQMAHNEARLRAEVMAQRQAGINGVTGLLRAAQPRAPGFSQTPGVRLPTVDYAGIIGEDYRARQRAHEAEMARWNSLAGGVMGMASGMLALSDRREKTDVKKVAMAQGFPVYRFRWRGAAGGKARPIQLGLMAQDVEKKKPEAVRHIGGRKYVDYGIALGR